jgi:hypothetical protein
MVCEDSGEEGGHPSYGSLEPQVRALAGMGFCKPCQKYYDDSKGLEAHHKRRHPRPPVPNDERDADGEMCAN